MHTTTNTILYIDDEPNNLIVFKNAFFKQYKVLTAESGEDGLKLMENEEVQLLITDQKMPGMSGVEVLARTAELYPDTIRIIITAYSDMEVILKAVNECGIYQYILKPWDSQALKIIVDNALKSYQLKKDNVRLVSDLKSANEQLEEKVKLRTAELHKNNMELEITNELKDKMFTIIAHDLRDPMVSLGVLLEVLSKAQDSIPNDEIEDYFLKVQNYVRDVLDLLNNLLEWSLTQTGNKKVQLEHVNVNTIIKHNVGLFQVPAGLKNITLSYEPCNETLHMLADKNMMNLVVRNLLSNAVKYSKKNSTVQLLVNNDNGKIEIAVADTGVGMSPEIQEKLFEETIYNLSSRGTAFEKGAGLGLKLCKEFVEKQDGQLQFDSEKGKGSVFKFTMPKAK